MKKCACKFYNGDFHNTHCDAGVAYRDVTTDPDNRLGIAFRKPCIDWEAFKAGNPMSAGQRAEWEKHGTCAKRQAPTDEEIAAWEEDMKKHTAKMMLTIPIISKVKQEHNESWAGVVECPACKGKLHLKLDRFGGIHGPQKRCHGKCETEGCVSWME